MHSRTSSLLRGACSLCQDLRGLRKVNAGMMVVLLPQEWAWQAVLLVTGLASLRPGSDGECFDVSAVLLSLCFD